AGAARKRPPLAGERSGTPAGRRVRAGAPAAEQTQAFLSWRTSDGPRRRTTTGAAAAVPARGQAENRPAFAGEFTGGVGRGGAGRGNHACVGGPGESRWTPRSPRRSSRTPISPRASG